MTDLAAAAKIVHQFTTEVGDPDATQAESIALARIELDADEIEFWRSEGEDDAICDAHLAILNASDEQLEAAGL